MVAERSFRSGFARIDEAFQHDLGRGRHLQVGAETLHQFRLAAAQQPGELVFRKRIGHRRDRRQDRRRVGADHHRYGERLAGARRAMLAKIQRTAAMRQPAHDDFVARNDLLAVDAEVLPLLLRPARDDQAPGDQRRGISRPAGLHRQSRQIDIGALPHDVLTWRRTHHLGRHVEHLFEHRQFVPGILQTLRRLGFLEVGQQRADFAQACLPVGAGAVFAFPGGNAKGHPARRAEQVGQHRNGMPFGFFEKQSRSAGAQHAVGDFGHFQTGIDLHRNPLEFAKGFELRNEIAQIGIFHGVSLEPISAGIMRRAAGRITGPTMAGD